MSNTNNTRDGQKSIRWQLLVTVSAAALLASVYGAEASDSDSDRPVLWIELGGQLDSMSGAQERFSPPFMASISQVNLLSALNVQRQPAFALDEDGKISFQPDGSDWVFSASIRYGRSAANEHRHQQTANAIVPKYHFAFDGYKFGTFPTGYYPNLHVRFADGQAVESESHAVLDFQAGKDVGLGMFGSRGASVLSVGVRIAQFTSKSNVTLRAEPDVRYPSAPIKSFYELTAFRKYRPHFHDYAAMLDSQRSFHGMGPSLAWNASVPFAGDMGQGELSLDWGINGAVLFGRQKATGRHQTAVRYYHETGWRQAFGGKGKIADGHFTNHSVQHYQYTGGPISEHTNSADINRSRMVVIPNLGGFVGLTYRVEDFKVSLGYRADFFFGAMDGGIDIRKSETLGFKGPFASVSVGIGG